MKIEKTPRFYEVYAFSNGILSATKEGLSIRNQFLQTLDLMYEMGYQDGYEKAKAELQQKGDQ